MDGRTWDIHCVFELALVERLYLADIVHFAKININLNISTVA